MPASHETIPQSVLSGAELLDVIINDMQRKLLRDGMFAPHIGYGRVAYRIRLEMELEIPSYPRHTVVVESVLPPRNDPDPMPIEPPPLIDPAEDAIVAGTEIERHIESPNKTRIEMGMPIIVHTRGPAGTVNERKITYDNTDLDASADSSIKDVTEETKKTWRKRK